MIYKRKEEEEEKKEGWTKSVFHIIVEEYDCNFYKRIIPIPQICNDMKSRKN